MDYSGRQSIFIILTKWFEKIFSDKSISLISHGKHHYDQENKQIISDSSAQILSTDHDIKDTESKISVNPENVKQSIIIGYCLVILLASLYVPWKVVKYNDNAILINFSLGYSFLFSSPMPSVASIDYGLVIFEIIATTSIAIILYVLKDKLSILISYIINLHL